MPTVARIAVVGAGLVGAQHIDAIKNVPNAELAAIVDTSEVASHIAADHEVAFVNSLDDLFTGHEIDGAILATPTRLHTEQGLQCIENRCPVLVEKPIATTTAEALQLVRAAAENKIAVLVGHHRRHNPLIQKAHEVISSGVIGQVRSAQGTCWLYKPDDYFDVAAWRKQPGAGPISVNLAHDIDLMRHLIGDVVAVQAASTKSLRGYDNEDVAAAVLTFTNGAVGTISVSDSIASPWSWELTAAENPVYPPTPQSCLLIGGSEGSLSIPDLTVWSHQGRPDWWKPISAMSLPRASSNPLANQIAHFAEVIFGDAEPLVSGIEGLKTLQVIEAIQRSAESGELVAIEKL